MSIKIGITGGIGSGKSVVAHLMQLAGMKTYDTDSQAKRIMNTDREIRRKLTDLVGTDLYKKGYLDTPQLAGYMFGHPERIEKVNAIVHPKVREDFKRWSESFAPTDIVGIESAILLEAGFRKEVDRLLMVYAPIETRISRAMQRDNATKEDIVKRIKAQMADEEKLLQADYVIVNDGIKPLISQVLQFMALLSENNPYLCR